MADLLALLSVFAKHAAKLLRCLVEVLRSTKSAKLACTAVAKHAAKLYRCLVEVLRSFKGAKSLALSEKLVSPLCSALPLSLARTGAKDAAKLLQSGRKAATKLL